MKSCLLKLHKREQKPVPKREEKQEQKRVSKLEEDWELVVLLALKEKELRKDRHRYCAVVTGMIRRHRMRGIL